MIPLERARAKAGATYDAAADSYDDPANEFWDRFGRRTIERLALRRGERVLDVCCGSGASAIPAAERVGPDGSVIGVDLAGRLLELAREKACRRGLRNLELRRGDMLELGLAEASFDAVVCVFGIFFVPDMVSAVRELWSRVRRGGRLAITTWGPRLFEPANGAFWAAVRNERPELYKEFNPWDRISDPAALRAMLAEGDAPGAEVFAESGSHPLPTPETWWSIVLGSGYRGTVEELAPEARERVRRANIDFLREKSVVALEANVVYAVATRGA